MSIPDNSIRGNSKISSHRKRRNNYYRDDMKGEFKKINHLPLMVSSIGEEIEAWLFLMNKYF